MEEIYNSQKNYSKYYDGSKRDIDKDLKPGAQVWLRFEGFELDGLKLKGTSAKLRPRFVGPFVIKEQVSDVSFRIKLPQTKIDSGLHDVFHSQLCAASQPIAAPLLIDRCNACIGPACGPLTTPDSASEQPGCTVALPHTPPSNQKSYHEDIPHCQIHGSIGGYATALIVLSPSQSLSAPPRRFQACRFLLK